MAESTCKHPDGCERPVHGYGWCFMHYKRIRVHGDPGEAEARRVSKRTAPRPPCEHPGGCPKESTSRGLCPMHYTRLMKTGELGPAESVKAANGKGSTTKSGYRFHTIDGERIYEHRFVMEQLLGRPLRDFENVHHINGVRDDNRPENLELWVRAQPAGQRAQDLAVWVVETYPELVEAVLADRRQLRLIASNQ